MEMKTARSEELSLEQSVNTAPQTQEEREGRVAQIRRELQMQENEKRDKEKQREDERKQADALDKIRRSNKIFQIGTFNESVREYVEARTQHEKKSAGLSGAWSRLKSIFTGKPSEADKSLEQSKKNLTVSADKYFEIWKEFYIQHDGMRERLEKKFSAAVGTIGSHAKPEERLRSIFDYTLNQGLAGKSIKGFESMFFTADEYKEKVFDTLRLGGERRGLRTVTYNTYKKSEFYDSGFEAGVQQIISELENQFGAVVKMKLQLHDNDVIDVWADRVSKFVVEQTRTDINL